MNQNQELINEYEENFAKVKEELKFKATLEELEKIFFVKDLILKERFVSPDLSRQICHRIAGLYGNWAGYLHSLLMPNPQNMMNYNESKQFSAEEKKEISSMVSQAAEMSSRNTLIGLNKNKKQEAELIDDSVDLWNKGFEEKLIKIMGKINSAWKEDETK